MTKISQLPIETSPTDDDYITIVDNATGQTRKLTIATLMQRPAVPSFDGRINNNTGTRSSTTGSLADIPGTPSITITAGQRAIKVHTHAIIMGNAVTGGGYQCFINANGTNRPAGMYFDTQGRWQVQSLYEIIDVAAGASVTLKMQWTGTSGGLQICNATGDGAYPEFLRGWIQVV